MPQGTVLERHGFSQESLGQLRRFLRLGESEREAIAGLLRWAERSGPSIVEDLVEWEFASDAALPSFQSYADAQSIPLTELRTRLIAARSEYFKTIFSAAPEGWGISFAESRVEMVHLYREMGLSLGFYLSVVAELRRRISRSLRSSLRPVRSWRRIDFSALDQAEESVGKIFDYEIQIVSEACTRDAIASCGFEFSSLGGDSGFCSDDSLGVVEELSQTLQAQCLAIAENRMNDPVLEQRIPGKMGETLSAVIESLGFVAQASREVNHTIQNVAASTEEMTASIGEISQNAHLAAKSSNDAVAVAQTTNSTVEKLGDSSREIGNVIKVINSIAEQTNLLALNATIEAARAGAAGRGFAVVANEVKELAKETSKATEDIARKIEAIQGDALGAVGAIGQIAQAIEQLNEISNSIAAAVEEQTATTNEMAQGLSAAVESSQGIVRSLCASESQSAEPEFVPPEHAPAPRSLEGLKVAGELPA